MADGILGRVLSEILGFGVGQTLANALAPEAELLGQTAWQLTPIRPLDVQTAALLVRLGWLNDGEGVDEAKLQGVNGERFGHLVSGTRTPPASSELLELSRRGELDTPQVKEALLRAGLDERYVDEYVKLTRIHLSAQDAAMARQQGFLSPEESHIVAALNGVIPQDADTLYEMSGLPPGLGEAMELLRRGEIDEAMFAQMVREGHTKTKYTDELLKLRWTPLSASIAAEALVRQRMSEEEAVKIGEENGLKKEDFLRWSEMLGRPIAIGEALTLARRGEFTYSQFVDAVARSDVRTEFAPDLWKLRTVYPSLMQLSRMIAAGSVPDELIHTTIIKLGYTEEWAKAIVDAGHKGKTAKTRDLAASQIDLLYETGLEDEKWATESLMHYGYDKDEAALHLQLLDARRILAALQADISVIHRTYVGHKIDRETAQKELDSLAVGAKAQTLLLEAWDNERAANVARLTNAQIGRALKLGSLTVKEALARWGENGYSPEDALILAELALKSPHVTAAGAATATAPAA